MIELAANLLVAFLLVLTTSWCVLLYRRLDRLRVERRDIEAFVAAIDGAVRAGRAGDGRHPRRRRARRSARSPAEQEQAQQRAAELARLVDSAGRMARRVETAIHQGARGHGRGQRSTRERGAARSPRGDAAGSGSLPQRRDGARAPGRPRIDAELLKALEALR